MIGQRILELIVIAFGIKIAFFDNGSSKKAVEFQNKTFGFKFGDDEVKSTRIGSIVVGVLFIAAGLASMFGLLDGFRLH